MLCGSVTSKASNCSRSDDGSTSWRTVRIVAMTCQPCAWKCRAISRPKPDEQPVTRTLFKGITCKGIDVEHTVVSPRRTHYNLESGIHLQESGDDRSLG